MAHGQAQAIALPEEGAPKPRDRPLALEQQRKPGETGDVFEAGNPAALAAKAIYILEDPERQKKMGAAAGNNR